MGRYIIVGHHPDIGGAHSTIRQRLVRPAIPRARGFRGRVEDEHLYWADRLFQPSGVSLKSSPGVAGRDHRACLRPNSTISGLADQLGARGSRPLSPGSWWPSGALYRIAAARADATCDGYSPARLSRLKLAQIGLLQLWDAPSTAVYLVIAAVIAAIPASFDVLRLCRKFRLSGTQPDSHPCLRPSARRAFWVTAPPLRWRRFYARKGLGQQFMSASVWICVQHLIGAHPRTDKSRFGPNSEKTAMAENEIWYASDVATLATGSLPRAKNADMRHAALAKRLGIKTIHPARLGNDLSEPRANRWRRSARRFGGVSMMWLINGEGGRNRRPR